MLLFFLICVSMFFIISATIIYKKILNPITIILVWYNTNIIVSHSGFMGMFKPKAFSSEFILINILILCFTFFLFSIIKKRKNIVFKMDFHEKKIEKIIIFFRIVSLTILLIIFFNIFFQIIAGKLDFSDIRMLVYSLSYNSEEYKIIFLNDFIYNFFSFFIKGFVLFDVSWNISESLLESKKFRKITTLNLFLYCVVILSRIEILRIFIIFVLVVFSVLGIKNKKNFNFNSSKKNIKKIIIFFAVAMVLIFSLRTSDGNSIIITTIQELIVSLTGSFVVFGNFYSDYFNGLSLIDSNIIAIMFGGLEPIFGLISSVLGFVAEAPTSILNQHIIGATNIGASDHYNAFYTMYYNFLAAGGIIGSALASIILGLILSFLYKMYLKNLTAETLLLYVMFLHFIILGTIRWELSTFSLWIMLIFGIFVVLKKNI